MKHSYDSWRRIMVRFRSRLRHSSNAWVQLAAAQSQPDQPELSNVHFHVNSYIREGTVSSTFIFRTGGLKGLSLALEAAALF